MSRISSLKLSKSGSQVSLLLTNGMQRSSVDVSSAIAWRPKMQYLSMQSMKTMHYVPELDGKLLRYGVSSIAAIAVSLTCVVAYA